jgi:Tfp pilus assembly protein PilN
MTMLRTNLATRPFYNERLVQWILGVAAVLVLLFTAFNVSEYLRLSGRQGGLEADLARDEAAARTLTAKAADARRRIDAKSLQRISEQALEANGIIDARTFSWTALFDDIEATLPPTVMLTSITPKIREDGATVSLVVVGKTVEAIDTFIERLEATGRFKGVQAATEVVTDEGSFETLLNGRYTAPAAPAATPASAPAAAGPGRQGAR